VAGDKKGKKETATANDAEDKRRRRGRGIDVTLSDARMADLDEVSKRLRELLQRLTTQRGKRGSVHTLPPSPSLSIFSFFSLSLVRFLSLSLSLSLLFSLSLSISLLLPFTLSRSLCLSLFLSRSLAPTTKSK
jgi:hypothetical protein